MPEQLPKTGLPAPFTFSQSSLQDYVDCPRRFQLHYIEQLQWPAVETAPVLENERRQLEGQQFHRLVQQALLGLPAEKLAKMAHSDNLGRWWDHWQDFRSLQDFGSLYPELTLSAPLGQHRLIAKYDLLALSNRETGKPDNRITIFDWKTSLKRPKNEWMAARLQTKVYRAMLVEAGKHLNGGIPFQPEQIEMVYWYAEFPDDPARFPYDAAQHRRAWDSLASLVSEIAAKQSFPLTDDEKKCAFCLYRSYCERGVRAGKGEEAEPELSEPEMTLEQIQEIEF